MDFGNIKIVFGLKVGNPLIFTPFFAYFWLFFGYWCPIDSIFGPKYTSDWLSYIPNGLYYQSMNFGHLEIIFGFRIWNFVFLAPIFPIFGSFIGHWTSIEYKIGAKYTSNWLNRVPNDFYYQIMDFRDLEMIFSFKAGNVVFFNPFLAMFYLFWSLKAKWV